MVHADRAFPTYRAELNRISGNPFSKSTFAPTKGIPGAAGDSANAYRAGRRTSYCHRMSSREFCGGKIAASRGSTQTYIFSDWGLSERTKAKFPRDSLIYHSETVPVHVDMHNGVLRPTHRISSPPFHAQGTWDSSTPRTPSSSATSQTLTCPSNSRLQPSRCRYAARCALVTHTALSQAAPFHLSGRTKRFTGHRRMRAALPARAQGEALKSYEGTLRKATYTATYTAQPESYKGGSGPFGLGKPPGYANTQAAAEAAAASARGGEASTLGAGHGASAAGKSSTGGAAAGAPLGFRGYSGVESTYRGQYPMRAQTAPEWATRPPVRAPCPHPPDPAPGCRRRRSFLRPSCRQSYCGRAPAPMRDVPRVASRRSKTSCSKRRTATTTASTLTCVLPHVSPP